MILSSFALLFLAEMGDKTQLMAMTLAHRYRALPVATGVCAAFLVLNLLAVAVGEVLGGIRPDGRPGSQVRLRWLALPIATLTLATRAGGTTTLDGTLRTR